MMWNYDGGWSWVWMGSAMILFWVAVILLAIWAFRAVTRRGQTGDSAISTLGRRLAAGEISQDEFDRTKKSLEVSS